MKTSYSPYSIVKALDACKEIMGKYNLVTSGYQHSRFNCWYNEILKEMNTHVYPDTIDIDAIASYDYKVINQWLKDKEFNLQVPEFPHNNVFFGTAATLKVLLEWTKRCVERRIETEDKKEYPGFTLENVSKYILGGKSIYYFTDKNFYSVYIAEADKDEMSRVFHPSSSAEIDELDLFDSALNIAGTGGYHKIELVVPMIDYQETSRLDWLEGMHVMGDRVDMPSAKIEIAMQQNIFKMDEIGAEIKSASYIGYSGCSGWSDSGTEYIRKPFLLWVYAPGCNYPLFVGYFDERYWKRPVREIK